MWWTDPSHPSLFLYLQKGEQDNAGAKVKWAVACSILSTVFSGLVLIAHLLPIASTLVVGTLLEGFLSFALAVGWGCTVAIVTKADDTSLVFANGTVSNANLYYFSWACFMTAVIMLVNYTRHRFGLDLTNELSTRGARLNLWAALIATSLVVAGSSGRSLNDWCKDSVTIAAVGEEFCSRTKFGIATGSIGVFLAVAVVGMKMCTVSSLAFLEIFIAGFAAVLNGFGVAFITSNKGPGAAIGNLYYFSWASFLLAALLLAECFGQARPSAANDDTKEEGDIEVEDLESH